MSILNDIADELENILQRSCISLRTVQDIGFDESKFHQNVSSQDPVESIRHVFDKYSDYSGNICDKSTTYIKEDPVNNAGNLTVNVTENPQTLGTNQSCLKTEFLRRGNTTASKSHLRQPSTYLTSKYPSAYHKSSTCNETQESMNEDEFDSCFDGLILNEETVRNFGRSFTTPTTSLPCNGNTVKTLIGKKPSPLLEQRKLGESGSELKSERLSSCAKISGGFGNFRSGLGLKQENTNVKFLGNHNADLSKNDSELLDVSGKLSFHRDSGNEVLANKKIYKITNVKNVLLRSRHLSDRSTLESSTLLQTRDSNAETSDTSIILGGGCNKFGNDSNSVVSKENYKHKVEQSCFNITREACKDEAESSFRDTCRRDEYWLDFLGRRLAHGKENEMSLALEILKKQFTSSDKARNEFSFHLDLISVQTVVGPHVCNSCILEGAVVELTKENQSIVANDPDTPRPIALVKGDITYNYRHPGFKDSVQVTHILKKDYFCNSSLNAQSEWMDRVMLLIKSLNLGVVALHGRVTSVLRDRLQALGVIVLENLSNQQLDVLSRFTGTSIVSYILDLTAHDLGKPVVVRIWESGWSSGKHSAKSHVVETLVFCQIGLWPDEQFPKLNSLVYSVVLCGPVQDLVDDSELKFWNCAHRLRNAFEDQCVLPGGGDIERICVKYLEDIRGNLKCACLNVCVVYVTLIES